MTVVERRGRVGGEYVLRWSVSKSDQGIERRELCVHCIPAVFCVQV